MFPKKLKITIILSTICIAITFVGIIILLALRSILCLVLFILFWILTNLAGGIICSQCPFRGKRCPGLYQLYFMPFLSKKIYKKKEYDKKTINISAILVSVFGSIYYLIGFISLFILYWNDFIVIVLILLAFFIIHLTLSFLYLCPNCSNKENCPMARVSKALGKE